MSISRGSLLISARFSLVLFLCLIVLLSPLSSVVYALSDEQYNVISKGIYAFDVDIPSCVTSTDQAYIDQLGSSDTGVPSADVKEWVEKYGKQAYETGQKYHLPYVAILAQAALESGWGRSGLTRKANNFFGIKAGSSWDGEVVYMDTGEQTKTGESYTQKGAAFRKYPTAQDGFDGYGKFITENSRYKKALAYPNDPAKYISEIKAAGYATDVKYVSKNVSLQQKIESHIVSLNNPSLPASKNVVFSTPNPVASGGTDGTSTPTDSCSVTNPETPGGAVTIVGDKAFPLAVSSRKEVLNPKSYSNSTVHVTYKANDILAKKGTRVVAMVGGKIRVSPNTDACSTRFVQIYNPTSNITVTNMHLSGDIAVKSGETVTAGAAIGYITPGVNKPGYSGGCGVSHLHIDAVKGQKRPSCSRMGCSNSSVFVSLGDELTKLYNALPK